MGGDDYTHCEECGEKIDLDDAVSQPDQEWTNMKTGEKSMMCGFYFCQDCAEEMGLKDENLCDDDFGA